MREGGKSVCEDNSFGGGEWIGLLIVEVIENDFKISVSNTVH